MGNYLAARVEGLYVGRHPSSLVTTPVHEINVNWGGFVGDRHCAIVKRSGVRERDYPKGTLVRNNRQISAVSVEELAEIAKAMGLPHLSPEWLGANLLLSGVSGGLTNLPPLTKLFFPEEAVIVVYGENLPCHLPGEVIQKQYSSSARDLAPLFPKAALHKRGIVGWVERMGMIRVGDEVRIKLPRR